MRSNPGHPLNSFLLYDFHNFFLFLDELVKRKELIESKSPAELANISSLGDIPVPTKIKRMMSPSEKIIAKQK